MFFDFQQHLYLLIGCLERDLREILEEFVFSSTEVSFESSGIPDGVIERANKDAAYQEGSTRISDYLETNDSWKLINRNAELIPDLITSVVVKFTPRLDSFGPIRQRVMHFRPLESGDRETVLSVCEDLAQERIGLANLEKTMRLLKSGEDLPVDTVDRELDDNAVLNNLPRSEFDETGFVGRSQELASLKKIILDSKYPVVTLRGPGGIGKTALAVKVLDEIIWDSECPFEVVFWHSLKENELTPGGVVQLGDTVSDALQIAQRIQDTVIEEPIDAAADLAENLRGIPTLIALDNLDTDDGLVFRELYEVMPPTVSFLTTTRVGIGELEKVMDLQPLEEKHSVHLMRVLARNRQLDVLNGLDEQTAQQAVRILRNNPLAIKWFVEAVEAGVEPEEALENQDELLEFSIGAVYRSLSQQSKDIASLLLYAEKPMTKAEMALALEVSTLSLNQEVMKLQVNSIISRVRAERATLEVVYELNPTVRDYLRLIPESEAAASVQKRVQTVNDAEERLERDRDRSVLNPNSIAEVEGSDKERAVSLMLREALSFSKRGDYSAAVERAENARELMPSYYEIPRVLGFIRAHHEPSRANGEYEEAYRLARDWHKGKVRYFQSWLLLSRVRNLKMAEAFAREAHSLLDLPASALRLGDVLMQKGEFEAAEELILGGITATEIEKTRLIGHTLLLSLAKRRVEYLVAEEKRPGEGLRIGVEAFSRACAYIDQKGIADRRLRETAFSLLTECLGTASRVEGPGWNDGQTTQSLLGIVDEALKRVHLFMDLDASVLVGAAGRLMGVAGVEPDVETAIEELIQALQEVPQDTETVGGGLAIVDHFKGGRNFGFLQVDQTDERLYFSTAQVKPEERLLMVAGRRVRFTRGTNSQGPCAENVEVEMSAVAKARALLERVVEVTEVEETYAKGKEVDTGSSVLLYASGFQSSEEWDRVSVGDEVLCDIDAEKGDRPVKGTALVRAKEAA